MGQRFSFSKDVKEIQKETKTIKKTLKDGVVRDETQLIKLVTMKKFFLPKETKKEYQDKSTSI